MSGTSRNLVILAGVAAALVALVLWVGRREYQQHPPALTAINPHNVTRLELAVPAQTAQSFQKRDDGWWRVQPSTVRADDARIGYLAKLAATPVLRWFPLGQTTAAKLGLAPPSVTLVLNGVKLEYGGLAAIGDFRYVRLGDKIALVPRQNSPRMVLGKDKSH